MTTGWRQLLLAGIALAACTIGSSARADVIDGNWCGPDGRVFTITGPRIVTPAGTATTGDYSRHSFAYVVPASDPGAGAPDHDAAPERDHRPPHGRPRARDLAPLRRDELSG